MSRVGRDAAGIAWAPAALAAPPGTPSFSLRISIARPFGTGSSAKTVDGLLPNPRSEAVLDEKCLKPQCQKIVRWAVLSKCPGRGAAFFMLLRRAGTHPECISWAPGSAAHHAARAARCAASGARPGCNRCDRHELDLRGRRS